MMHCYSLSDAGDQERGQGYETTQSTFQVGMPALGIIHENCAEFIGRLRWEIWINSDILQYMAQLESRSVKLF